MAFMIATPRESSDTWHIVGMSACSLRQSSCYIVVVRSIDSSHPLLKQLGNIVQSKGDLSHYFHELLVPGGGWFVFGFSS